MSGLLQSPHARPFTRYRVPAHSLSHVRSPPRPSTDSLACPSHLSPGPGMAFSRIRRGCSGRLRTVGHGNHLAIQIRKWFIRYPDYTVMRSRLTWISSKHFQCIAGTSTTLLATFSLRNFALWLKCFLSFLWNSASESSRIQYYPV